MTANTEDLDYAQALSYLQHFRDKECDEDFISDTESIFTLCWFYAGLIDELKQELKKKKVHITRLNEIIFGQAKHTEDEKDETEETPINPETNDKENKTTTKASTQKGKGHGRRGVDGYPGAKVVTCECDEKEGSSCPLCKQGKLRRIDPKTRIQFDGITPLFATRYDQEQLACTHCPYKITAKAPVDTDLKYTEKAKATLAYLHYGMGSPYNRLAIMLDMQGHPIAVSTQSDLIASMMGPGYAVFNHMLYYAAQSDWVYQDDTPVKIQELTIENKTLSPARKGMYTSGFIADSTHRVVLFFSGRAHAGENFDKIMIHRDEDKECVNRMADALAANSKHKAPVNEAKCNAHAFRRFRSLIGSYNNESKFVMGIYDQVYEHDKYCKKHHHTDQQRLAYHQEHSLPLMNKLRYWAKEQLNESAEPNSVLAAECKYLLNHWPGLTQFLALAGAPLDNNALEAMLKMMIMYRKNSQIFKTAYSAEYGSRLISIIATCRVNSSNAIDYLTQIQKHEPAVWANPEAWMPWSYQQTLQNMTNPI